MDQQRHNYSGEDLEINKYNMQNFIDGPIEIRTIFIMLQNELNTSSKTVYPDSMEARVCSHLVSIMQFWDIITQYQAWHLDVTKRQHVEVVELYFTQNQAS